jgi:hypothetical protein
MSYEALSRRELLAGSVAAGAMVVLSGEAAAGLVVVESERGVVRGRA